MQKAKRYSTVNINKFKKKVCSVLYPTPVLPFKQRKIY